MRRLWAVLEVLAVFLGVNLLVEVLRGIPTLAEWDRSSGFPLTRGLVLLLAALGMRMRWKPEELPLQRPRVDHGGCVVDGLITGLILAALTPLLSGRSTLLFLQGSRTMSLGLVTIGGVLTTVTTLYLLRARDTGRQRAPTAPMGFALTTALVLLGPTLLALSGPWSWRWILLRSAHLVFIAAYCEEHFYRGYVQARLQRAFGDLQYLAGVRWGWGLAIASCLFGLGHVELWPESTGGWIPVSTVHATFASLTPLGFLYSKHRSLLSPIVAHAVLDVSLLYPMVSR